MQTCAKVVDPLVRGGEGGKFLMGDICGVTPPTVKQLFVGVIYIEM